MSVPDNDNPFEGGPEAAPPGDYAVGYGKPPKATKFKKGQSGNPSGRSKEPQVDDVRLLLDRILAEPVKVQEAGQVRTITNLESILHIQMTNALKGSKKATRALIKHAKRAGLFTRPDPYAGVGGVVEVPFTGAKGKILRLYRAEKAARAAAADQNPPE